MCVFLGYPPGIKGYRLLDLHTRETFISRDVIFHENIFPFHNIKNKSVLADPFPDFVLPLPLADLSDQHHSDNIPAAQSNEAHRCIDTHLLLSQVANKRTTFPTPLPTLMIREIIMFLSEDQTDQEHHQLSLEIITVM